MRPVCCVGRGTEAHVLPFLFVFSALARSLPPSIHLLVSAGGEPASDICSELAPIARHRWEMPIDACGFAPFDPRNLHFPHSLLFRGEPDFAAASKVAGLFPWMSATPFRSALFRRVLAGITLSYREFICMIVSPPPSLKAARMLQLWAPPRASFHTEVLRCHLERKTSAQHSIHICVHTLNLTHRCGFTTVKPRRKMSHCRFLARCSDDIISNCLYRSGFGWVGWTRSLKQNVHVKVVNLEF